MTPEAGSGRVAVSVYPWEIAIEPSGGPAIEGSAQNRLPAEVAVGPASEGRGVRGMRQRVGQLGGIISVGPTADGWSVRTNIPLGNTDPTCPWAS